MIVNDADKPGMIDMLDAESVEVLLDDTGKLWVNVDGACRLRIGSIKYIETTLDNLTVSWTKPGIENAKT